MRRFHAPVETMAAAWRYKACDSRCDVERADHTWLLTAEDIGQIRLMAVLDHMNEPKPSLAERAKYNVTSAVHAAAQAIADRTVA